MNSTAEIGTVSFTRLPSVATSLVQLQQDNNFNTDKNSRHFYLQVYDDIFKPYQMTPGNFLEIGVEFGGSMSLWTRYFTTNKKIVGMDIAKYLEHMPERDKVEYFFGGDAYLETTAQAMKQRYGTFDIIIDDGPHNLQSHLFFIEQYSKLINKGLLIIEDVDRALLPTELQKIYSLDRNYSLTVYDRNSSRHKSDYLDDCLIVIEFV